MRSWPSSLISTKVNRCLFFVALDRSVLPLFVRNRVAYLEVGMSQSYRDLDVWKAAIDLTTEIYRITEGFPRHEIYGLTSQMRRSAVSIPSNIAEGSARATKRDFANFISIAKGSNAELQTQLLIALRLGYISQEPFDVADALSARVAQMLARLSAFLRSEQQVDTPRTNNEKRTTR